MGRNLAHSHLGQPFLIWGDYTAVRTLSWPRGAGSKGGASWLWAVAMYSPRLQSLDFVGRIRVWSWAAEPSRHTTRWLENIVSTWDDFRPRTGLLFIVVELRLVPGIALYQLLPFWAFYPVLQFLVGLLSLETSIASSGSTDNTSIFFAPTSTNQTNKADYVWLVMSTKNNIAAN